MPPHPIVWRKSARDDVRAIDSSTAMKIFDGILHYAQTGAGSAHPLHGDMTGAFRLRVGDYRVFFWLEANAMHIFGVRHRGEAYR